MIVVVATIVAVVAAVKTKGQLNDDGRGWHD
jgi:hypothetical protein